MQADANPGGGRGRSLKSKTIDVEHLLLGILRDEKSFAGTVLREHGVDFAVIAERVEANQPVDAQPRSGMDVIMRAMQEAYRAKQDALTPETLLLEGNSSAARLLARKGRYRG